MSNEPFIKRGVVEGETEEKPVVTDSDQTVKAASMPGSGACCGRCRCGKSAAAGPKEGVRE